MRLGLPPHVHIALSGSFAVFLDTQHDRYRAVRVSPSKRGIFEGRRAADDGDSFCRSLSKRHILVPLEGQARPVQPTRIEIASRSILETMRPRASLSPRTAMLIGRSLRRTMAGLKRRGLSETLDRIGRKKRDDTLRLDAAHACEIALSFAAHRSLLPAKRICLRDSLALLDLLGREGCAADLVFAVQADPFYAHCWVQAGRWILNDSAYFPQTLSPILRL